MNSEIKQLLIDIKNKPGMYIGEKSLDKLVTFVSGYMHCMNQRDKIFTNDFEGFQEFIEKNYDIYNNVHFFEHWSVIIEFFCSIKENAFDKFYELLEESLEEIGDVW